MWGIEGILFCPSIDPRLFWPNTIFFGTIQIVSARSKIVLNNIELDKAFDNGQSILLVSVVGVTVVVITDVVIGVVATEGFKIGSSKMLLDEGNSITKRVLLSDFFWFL